MSAPVVAVLCAAPRARVAAAEIALALAAAAGAPGALAGVLGTEPGPVLGGLPAARRAAATLRREDLPAVADGRLVWLADRRGAASGDVAGHAAALSAEVGRCAAAIRLPAAVALPVARSVALDRVLAWHDAIVVVREPEAPDGMLDRALASVAALGRPVAAIAPPRRLAGALSLVGLIAPPEAAATVAHLGLGAARDA